MTSITLARPCQMHFVIATFQAKGRGTGGCAGRRRRESLLANARVHTEIPTGGWGGGWASRSSFSEETFPSVAVKKTARIQTLASSETSPRSFCFLDCELLERRVEEAACTGWEVAAAGEDAGQLHLAEGRPRTHGPPEEGAELGWSTRPLLALPAPATVSARPRRCPALPDVPSRGGELAAPRLRGVRAARRGGEWGAVRGAEGSSAGRRGPMDGRTDARGGGAQGARGAGGPAGQSPRASACLRAFSRRSAILEFLLLLFAAAATTAAAEADSASEAMGSPKGGGGNIR